MNVHDSPFHQYAKSRCRAATINGMRSATKCLVVIRFDWEGTQDNLHSIMHTTMFVPFINNINEAIMVVSLQHQLENNS